VNASLKAQHAYAAHAPSTRSAKAIEYQAIARVTHQLKSAAQRGHQAFPQLAVALELNRRLWRVLALDVASDGNALPEPLRLQILGLAEFTFAHTRDVLARRETVDPLIDVNTAMLRGLNSGKR